MSQPKREQVLEVFRTRLAGIAVLNGFRTNFGDHVLFGVLTLGEHDPDDVISVLVGEETILGQQREKLTVALPVQIYVLTTAQPSDACSRLEAGIADVKQAIERVDGDRYLTGLASERIVRGGTVTLPRESGSQMVGAMVPYLVKFTETWGDPES